MLTPSTDNSLLSHELQLGEQLNQCVHSQRRSDFSLMLAMLADDVREQSQFKLPQTELPEVDNSNEALRKRFHLPKQAPLGLSSTEQIEAFSQADKVAGNKLADIKLSAALNALPIAFRDNKNHIPTPVVTNTSLHCQRQFKQANAEEGVNQAQRLDFDAKAWLETIQITLVKQPLLATA